MKPHGALIDKHIGAQLARRRWELNMNIGSVAESLQVGPRTVVRWEAGAERTPPQALLHLTHLFGCQLSYFFETALAPARSHHRSHLRIVGGRATVQAANNMLGANERERARDGLSRKS